MEKQEGFHFVGAGDFGRETIIELSKAYNALQDDPRNHLHMHAFPRTRNDPGGWDRGDVLILAGKVDDPAWNDARCSLHAGGAFFILTIGVDDKNTQEYSADALPTPFTNECIVLADRSISSPAALAGLVLQFVFIHTPWQQSAQGSLIGHDLADTKRIFSGKVAKIRVLTANQEDFRQSFSRFLAENSQDIRRAQGILMSLWASDGVLSIPQANNLWEETADFLNPDADRAYTLHVLPEGGPVFTATMFLAFSQNSAKWEG
jgi:hypothetical protein